MPRNLTALVALFLVALMVGVGGFGLGLFQSGPSSDSTDDNRDPEQGQGKDGAQPEKERAAKEKTPDNKEGTEAARMLILAAISAHGGTTALERVPTMIRTGSGTGVSPYTSKEDTCSQTVYFDLPYRVRAELDFGAEKRRFTVVLNATHGWVVAGGMTQEASPTDFQGLQAENYSIFLTALVPIRDDRDFTLKTVPGIDTWGKKTDGVSVSRKDRQEVRLYFDKESGLLVRTRRHGSNAGLVNTRDLLLGEHKEFRGAKLATHLLEEINGQKSMELKDVKYTFPAAPDARLFEKP